MLLPGPATFNQGPRNQGAKPGLIGAAPDHAATCADGGAPAGVVAADSCQPRHDLADDQRGQLRIDPTEQDNESRTVEAPQPIIHSHFAPQESARFPHQLVGDLPPPGIVKLTQSLQPYNRHGDRFTLTVGLIEGLLGKAEKGFARIESRHEIVHDRGPTSVHLRKRAPELGDEPFHGSQSLDVPFRGDLEFADDHHAKPLRSLDSTASRRTSSPCVSSPAM